MANKPSRALTRGPRQAERDARPRVRGAPAGGGCGGGASRADQRAATRLHERQERRDAVIFAPNWRTPIVVDVILGGLVLVVGAVFAVIWNPLIAGGIGALGGLYVVMALQRWHNWSERRRAAGLDV